MNSNLKWPLLLALLLSMSSLQVKAQDLEEDDDLEELDGLQGIKGFHVGFYLGGFFANKSTTGLYDGYGFDLNGERNTFANSFMYRKIFYEYGGGNGQTDIIAEQMNVDPGTWHFTESDMPSNLKYKPAFMLGLHLNHGFTKRDNLLLNLNFARLTVEGNFTITIDKPPNQNQFFKTIYDYPLRGNEQRMQLQLGYGRIFGNNKFVNFFAEAGFSVNYAKLQKYFIQIESLRIDLTSFSNLGGYNYIEPEQYIGWGVGVFGGAGVYLRLNSRYTAKILYAPSYEKVNIGLEPKATLQHNAGLRIYYRL